MDNYSDSDYEVEDYVKPSRIVKPINDERADLLGNFDENKRSAIFNDTYDSNSNSSSGDSCKTENEEDLEELDYIDNGDYQIFNDDIAIKTNEKNEHSLSMNTDEKKPTNVLSKEQLTRLRRGAKKADRYVLYVTNLNFETTPGILKDYFNTKGKVSSIRIPKRKRAGCAFVEMEDIDSYQRAFELHNTELMGRNIKIQYSEAGKKKSANKKNILKQKNRKLAEMRHEYKLFTKSGKFYDKSLKKAMAQEALIRKKQHSKVSKI